MSLATLNAQELAVIPGQIVRAHASAEHAVAVSNKRRRKFFRSLFLGEKEDELHAQLLAASRCVDELSIYIVYRKTRKNSLGAAFDTKMALRRQHAERLDKLIESGNVRLDSLPLKLGDEALFASIDEAEQCLSAMDAAALGLIATFNNLVREIERFSDENPLCIPRSQPLPKPITTE